MKTKFKLSILLSITLILFVTAARAQYTQDIVAKSLGCIHNNDYISFTITITNLVNYYPDGNNYTVTLDDTYGTWLDLPEGDKNFTLYYEGEQKTITVFGTYPSDWVIQAAWATVNISDSKGNSSYVLVDWTYCGPSGVGDYITIDEGDFDFSENDALYFKSLFTDYDPIPNDPDYVTEWNLKINLSTTNGDYLYYNQANTNYSTWSEWSFIAPALSPDPQYIRNGDGKIFGVVIITGLDNDGILHKTSHDILINKVPKQPDLFPVSTGTSSFNLHFLNTRASTYTIYYGNSLGGPYNGTGLTQGNSPIYAGTNSSLNIDGLQLCIPYYFVVKAINSFGESSNSEEKKLLAISSPNSQPIDYYYNDYVVSSSYTFTGNYYYLGNLIIQSGATVTLQGGYQYFDENSKIIIEPGGQLILDGATCTAPCSQTWQGIEVRGNAAEHQFEYEGHPLAQGKLVMKNGASIQNAWNAITTWKYNDWNTVGGIVLAENSSFINNKRSVEFMPYQNYHPFTGQPMGYVSHFINCQFIVDDNYRIPDFNYHITMNDVNGIKISGCEFTNNITSAQHTGEGIFTIDAGYRITDYCDAAIQPCPDTSILHTTFNNLYAGIIALNSQSSNTIYVNDAKFVNNGIGIKLNTVDNATIIFNDFYIGPDIYDSCLTNGFGLGIYLINSNGYAIEENNFYPAQSMTGDAIGVNVYYNPTDSAGLPIMNNEIYKNTFDSVFIANNTQGDNFDQDQHVGLVHLCNNNINNTYDFYITGQGIQYMQGSLDEPTGNKFSLNANNQYSDYNNQSDWSILYFHKKNNAAQTPVSYTEESFFPFGVDTSNQCLSHYGDITKQDKGFGLTTAQKQYYSNMFYANQVDYFGTKALYESLKDGGDTPSTITDVEGAWPDEMWETRNDLLAKSPHLTRKVLIETADRTDLFPDAVIFEILSANPDAMKDKTLLEYLETKENPLPQYMIDILRSTPETITYKTILESQLAEYGGKKSRAANIIIRNILNDSIPNTDSLINWLSNLNSMSADYQLIDVYLQHADTTAALTLIDALPSTYGFETDNAEYVRYKALKHLQIKLLGEGRNIYMLTAAEKTMLDNMVANSNGRSGMQARNILQFAYGNKYDDCPNIPDGSTHKSVKASIPELTSNMIDINASPNPANTWVTFNYSLPEISTNSIIEIHNVLGALVHVINLTNYQGQVIWDTRNVKPGVYLYTLKSLGTQKSGKLIIAK